MSESAADFFETWSVYDQLLDHNSLFHNELFADVRAILADRFGVQPFAILELGCGSARHSSLALVDRRITRYVGYDLSKAALTYARENLRRLGCPIELKLGNLLDEAACAANQYDVILSSFAIHHLSADDKQRFFHGVAAHLKPRGILVLIDPFRDEGEDRSDYLDRYCRWIRTDWKLQPEAAVEAVINHVRDCDFPETASVLIEMARNAGLVPCWTGRQFRWHRSFGFASQRISSERSSEHDGA